MTRRPASSITTRIITIILCLYFARSAGTAHAGDGSDPYSSYALDWMKAVQARDAKKLAELTAPGFFIDRATVDASRNSRCKAWKTSPTADATGFEACIEVDLSPGSVDDPWGLEAWGNGADAVRLLLDRSTPSIVVAFPKTNSLMVLERTKYPDVPPDDYHFTPPRALAYLRAVVDWSAFPKAPSAPSPTGFKVPSDKEALVAAMAWTNAWNRRDTEGLRRMSYFPFDFQPDDGESESGDSVTLPPQCFRGDLYDSSNIDLFYPCIDMPPRHWRREARVFHGKDRRATRAVRFKGETTKHAGLALVYDAFAERDGGWWVARAVWVGKLGDRVLVTAVAFIEEHG